MGVPQKRWIYNVYNGKPHSNGWLKVPLWLRRPPNSHAVVLDPPASWWWSEPMWWWSESVVWWLIRGSDLGTVFLLQMTILVSVPLDIQYHLVLQCFDNHKFQLPTITVDVLFCTNTVPSHCSSSAGCVPINKLALVRKHGVSC
jgi:hypothetical protein